MDFTAILVGVVSSLIASAFIALISLIIKMISNKTKLRAIVMVMLTKISYDPINQKINNILAIHNVFTYSQYIYLKELSVLIIGKETATQMIEIIGNVAKQITSSTTNINAVSDEINKLNDLFEEY